MENSIYERLEILKNAGQITGKMESAIVAFAKKMESEYHLNFDEENGAMLVTHFATALSRIERGETVEKMDDFLLEQIAQTPSYKALSKYLEVVEAHMGWCIPEAEIGYIAAHFCTVIEKGGMK
ncbi:PRD domain-containing protein [Fusibacter sp. 3D3]|uniref:PRD domain-containing protein n=1 Tax=Fusibacter sp. 3D3 TaxID=1048380 RepID=UPI000853AC0B|nr:PRD domain-containing protein [Fusibacter sp. 3D3]GAU75490.1 hypothetical protein F3D3_0081 [Fusibacter sp. 3D3]